MLPAPSLAVPIRCPARRRLPWAGSLWSEHTRIPPFWPLYALPLLFLPRSLCQNAGDGGSLPCYSELCIDSLGFLIWLLWSISRSGSGGRGCQHGRQVFPCVGRERGGAAPPSTGPEGSGSSLCRLRVVKRGIKQDVTGVQQRGQLVRRAQEGTISFQQRGQWKASREEWRLSEGWESASVCRLRQGRRAKVAAEEQGAPPWMFSPASLHAPPPSPHPPPPNVHH